MKKILTLVLCVSLLVTTLTCAACAEADKITIGFCNYANSSPFAYKVLQQMIKACDARGWELDATENLGEPETFMKCLDSYFLKEVDVIVAFWLDSAIAANAQSMCDAEGIPLIMMGCEPKDQVVVSADNNEFGRMVGEKLGEAALSKWSEPIDSILAVESALTGELNTIRMTSAVNTVLETVGLTDKEVEVVYVDDEFNSTKTQQNVTDAFGAHPYWQRTVVVCFDEEYSLAGTINAVVSEGLGEQVVVAEIQGYTELLYNAINDYDWVIGGGEHFSASFVAVIAELCEQYLNGETPAIGIYPVPLTFLSRENYQQFSYTD